MTVKTIDDATKSLLGVAAFYEAQGGCTKTYAEHEKVLKKFDEARIYLDALEPRNWESDDSLKGAYENALSVIEHSFRDYLRNYPKLPDRCNG